MTPKQVKHNIDTLRDQIKYVKEEAEHKIAALKDEILLNLAMCPHKNTKKVHSSSGSFWTQSIICKDCEQTLKTAPYLFNPKEADERYSSGN